MLFAHGLSPLETWILLSSVLCLWCLGWLWLLTVMDKGER